PERRVRLAHVPAARCGQRPVPALAEVGPQAIRLLQRRRRRSATGRKHPDDAARLARRPAVLQEAAQREVRRLGDPAVVDEETAVLLTKGRGCSAIHLTLNLRRSPAVLSLQSPQFKRSRRRAVDFAAVGAVVEYPPGRSRCASVSYQTYAEP